MKDKIKDIIIMNYSLLRQGGFICQEQQKMLSDYLYDVLKMQELKSFVELFREKLKLTEFALYKDDNIVYSLFYSESNYNNCDKTSGQQVYTESQILSFLKTWERLGKPMFDEPSKESLMAEKINDDLNEEKYEGCE